MSKRNKKNRSKGNPEASLSRTSMRKAGGFRKPSRRKLREMAAAKADWA